jgi:hypothetical protein
MDDRRQFMKTDPKVVEKIKEENLEKKPRKIFKSMVDEAGGPLHVSGIRAAQSTADL